MKRELIKHELLKQLINASLALATLVFTQAGSAQTTACLEHFADHKAPVLTRPALQTKTVGLCYEAFAVLHSGVSRTPLWSAEHLTRASLAAARTIRREDTFHPEVTLPPADRAQLADYAGSGYDRGHMSPAADMPSEQAQHESFSLANIVPQNRKNNQILWAAIESATRHIAQQNGELYVITGPVFEGDKISRINERVFVPSHVFKAVYDPQQKEGAAWIAPNIAGNDYQVISIAELEKRININLFPSLTAEIKEHKAILPEPRIRGHKPKPQ